MGVHLKRITELSEQQFKNISDFECREEEMSHFLKGEALAYDEEGEGNTFLVIDDNDRICAYYTIKANSIQIVDDNSKHNKYRVFPAVEIARLAVDMDFEGQSIGSAILGVILDVVNGIKKHLGIKFIYLYSLPDSIRFYKTKNKAKLKFKEFPKGTKCLEESCRENTGCTLLYVKL